MKRLGLITVFVLAGSLFMFDPVSVSALEEVPIQEETFPDPIFRSYVEKTWDANHDAVLSSEEIEAITNISVRNKGIQSLQGIEYFSSLQDLNCGENAISVLDVSQNTELIGLVCDENPISVLDVSHNPKLTALNCFHDALSQLDISSNTNLEQLVAGGSLLGSINTRHNPNLKVFTYLAGNAESFDFSSNPELESVWISGTPVKELDLSANKALSQLWCHNTNLSTIDLTGFPHLSGSAVNLTNNRMISIHTDIADASQISMQDQRPYKVLIPKDQTTFDLRNLDMDIDPSMIVPDGSITIENAVLQGVSPGMQVSYDYKVGTSTFKASLVFEEDNSWIQPLTIENWTYGQNPSLPQAQSAFGKVTYSYSASKDGPFEGQVPTLAGTWYVQAYVPFDGVHQELKAIREFQIYKAQPNIKIPDLLQGWKGDKLSSVSLPEGFSWEEGNQILNEAGIVEYKAKYTPEDTANYLTLDDILLRVKVQEKEADKEESNPKPEAGTEIGKEENEDTHRQEKPGDKDKSPDTAVQTSIGILSGSMILSVLGIFLLIKKANEKD